MKELPDLDAYRPNVGICLFNKAGQVWLGERVVSASARKPQLHRWQMPQGGADPDEPPERTAFRELYEETGVRSARLLLLTPGWLVYDFPPEYRTGRRGGWRGQRQKWAAMLFEGDDSEVDLAAHLPVEFSAWRWADLEEVPALVVPFKRPVYEALLTSFRPLAQFIAGMTPPAS